MYFTLSLRMNDTVTGKEQFEISTLLPKDWRRTPITDIRSLKVDKVR
jgi:hypothetical protein